MICVPTETPLEKIKFSFVCGYQLEIGSELGVGLGYTLPLRAGTPSDLNLCRAVNVATVSETHNICLSVCVLMFIQFLGCYK